MVFHSQGLAFAQKCKKVGKLLPSKFSLQPKVLIKRPFGVHCSSDNCSVINKNSWSVAYTVIIPYMKFHSIYHDFVYNTLNRRCRLNLGNGRCYCLCQGRVFAYSN